MGKQIPNPANSGGEASKRIGGNTTSSHNNYMCDNSLLISDKETNANLDSMIPTNFNNKVRPKTAFPGGFHCVNNNNPKTDPISHLPPFGNLMIGNPNAKPGLSRPQTAGLFGKNLPGKSLTVVGDYKRSGSSGTKQCGVGIYATEDTKNYRIKTALPKRTCQKND